jgi:hypothetical protein
VCYVHPVEAVYELGLMPRVDTDGLAMFERVCAWSTQRKVDMKDEGPLQQDSCSACRFEAASSTRIRYFSSLPAIVALGSNRMPTMYVTSGESHPTPASEAQLSSLLQELTCASKNPFPNYAQTPISQHAPAPPRR